jgi:aspartyl aminopeptidase
MPVADAVRVRALGVRGGASARTGTDSFGGSGKRTVLPAFSAVGWAFWIRTVDVGILVLSMHSAREFCGRVDPGYLAAACAAFLAPAAQRI